MSTSGLQFPSLDSAIQQMEGYFPGSLSYMNNNPGNIINSSFATSQGGSTGVGGFASFPTLEAGQQAMDNLLSSYANDGDTLQQALNKWVTGSTSTSAPSSYTSGVSSITGASPDTPLSSLLSSSSPTANSSTTPTSGTSTPSTSGSTSVFSWGRIAAFLIGIICLIFGFVNLKPVHDTVITVSKVGSKAAELAAS